ncbi:solute carrier family 45 member 3 isoform X1 [Silurus asotus]|uniref:Solute carrier family 45 member 3 isoform X1 n=1 Tax=Silurus asotus TaxID=30991 RepID=A0AAD5FHR6_SILAS|nr:solute carrier family 45 member 3 isoform X1 [Silurus asotus]
MPGWRSQYHLVLLNLLSCGLEICVAAGITYVPPLLLEAGIEEKYMTMVLGIGPVLGLVFIPLIGSASDHCSSSYGRRRPFIWLLSLGVLIAMLIIPNADILAAYLSWGGSTHPNQPLQVGLLILGVVLLDFCGQVCFTPLEALLSDLYSGHEECTRAFATFSFMTSLGSCMGYLLSLLNWSSGPLAYYLGGQAKGLFTFLILIFVICVLVTMKVSEEKEESDTWTGCLSLCYVPRRRFKICLPRASYLICMLRSCCSVTPAIFRSYCHVPYVMRRLCAAQLSSWMAIVSFMLFYTDFVGEGLYQGVPSAAPGTVPRKQYDEGIRMGSVGLFLQCATSTFFSLIMNRLVCTFGSRKVFLFSMVSFTLSALVICFSKSVLLVTGMSALTGFAFATLQTLPYTLTCHYHQEKEVYMPTIKTQKSHPNMISAETMRLTLNDDGNLKRNGHAHYGQDDLEFYPPQHVDHRSDDYEKRGVGLDFAILDSTFLLSQVFPSLFMGMIVQFTQSVTAYIASSAVFGAVSVYFATRVIFEQKDLEH